MAIDNRCIWLCIYLFKERSDITAVTFKWVTLGVLNIWMWPSHIPSVNNAGVLIINVSEVVPIESAKKLFDVNFFGTFRLTHEVLPIMKKQKSGRIVNIGSDQSIWGMERNVMAVTSQYGVWNEMGRLLWSTPVGLPATAQALPHGDLKSNEKHCWPIRLLTTILGKNERRRMIALSY